MAEIPRPKSPKTQEPGTSGPDKMAEDEDMDGLVTKISKGVFAELSYSLDTKLDQTVKSLSSVCEKVKVVERRWKTQSKESLSTKAH